jgi:hypothetical protein
MLQQQDLLEWTATLISITCSLFRAFNLGYQGWIYLISICANLIFATYATKKSQMLLNVFYIATALIGVYNWGLQ